LSISFVVFLMQPFTCRLNSEILDEIAPKKGNKKLDWISHDEVRREIEESSPKQNWTKYGEIVLEGYTVPDLQYELKLRGIPCSSKSKQSLIGLLNDQFEKEKAEIKKRSSLEQNENSTKRKKGEGNGKRYKIKMAFRRHTCHCVANVSESMSFEEMFEKLLNAFDFDLDHLYKAHLPNGRVLLNQSQSTYQPADSDEENALYGDTLIKDLNLNPGDSFGILFDYGDSWWFFIYVEDVEEGTPTHPFELLKLVGKAPKQYPEPDEDY